MGKVSVWKGNREAEGKPTNGSAGESLIRSIGYVVVVDAKAKYLETGEKGGTFLTNSLKVEGQCWKSIVSVF